jgi:hypothetical protein
MLLRPYLVHCVGRSQASTRFHFTLFRCGVNFHRGSAAIARCYLVVCVSSDRNNVQCCSSNHIPHPWSHYAKLVGVRVRGKAAGSTMRHFGRSLPTIPFKTITNGWCRYSHKADFATHYPYMLKYGYTTCYECMGMGEDVPPDVAAGHWPVHGCSFLVDSDQPTSLCAHLPMASPRRLIGIIAV